MRKNGRFIVIIGAGPTGLLAAHAARKAGYNRITVVSAPVSMGDPGQVKKSDLFGCQYLHAYIPDAGINMGGQRVKYTYRGPEDGYRRKVYGAKWLGDTSVDEYGDATPHMAWDLRKVYDTLWSQWQPRILPLEVTPNMAAELKHMNGGDDVVFLCTVPKPALCQDMENHRFVSQEVWAMGSYPGRQMPYIPEDFTVECNGEDAPRWYRAATVFGHTTVEWPAGPKPPIRGIASVSKPLSTDCACHTTDNWHWLGRYGKWQKGVLAHTAYTDTLELLK